MIWAQLLAYVTGTVDQELLLRNEYLAAENLWLANCYFAHNSLRFPALLTFFNAPSPSRGKHDGR